jgi:hypothetical protein
MLQKGRLGLFIDIDIDMLKMAALILFAPIQQDLTTCSPRESGTRTASRITFWDMDNVEGPDIAEQMDKDTSPPHRVIDSDPPAYSLHPPLSPQKESSEPRDKWNPRLSQLRGGFPVQFYLYKARAARVRTEGS